MSELYDAPALIRRVEEAERVVRPEVARTPMVRSAALSSMTGCDVFLKCEHLQHTGSFKYRGATNKLRALMRERSILNVITVSTGNHGKAVALAGKLAGVRVKVYVAATASPMKIEAIRALGAEVIALHASPLEVENEARSQAADRDAPFIQPYNDIDVIAGQGTLGLEVAEQCDDLAAMFISVGGGGLIAGAGTALKSRQPEAEIVGCWPANSPCLYQSMEAGEIIETEEFETLSDGTAGGVEAGAITLPICQQVIDRSLLVSESEIRSAMRIIAQSEQWMVEGAAGVALAAFLKESVRYEGRKVAVVLCGRNIALDRFLQAVA